MQSTFGSLYVNDFTLFGRNYKVNLASEGNFRERPEDLRHVFVRADGGAMIPLDTCLQAGNDNGFEVGTGGIHRGAECRPVMTTGWRLERAAYTGALYPAGPEPGMSR